MHILVRYVIGLLGLCLIAAGPSPADTDVAGFRGRIENLKWTAPPDDATTPAANPDIDLVKMGRWAQNYLVNNAYPSLDYACRFSLEWRCPPPKLEVELTANGDTDCRMDWEFMHLAEMCGVNQTADAASGVRKRILSYLGADHLAHVPGAIYCGSVPADQIYISPWSTGKILVSLAESFARSGDPAAKAQARQVFTALRALASWDGDRAWYPGGSGPYRDGKWYDTFITVNYGCQTEPVWRYGQLTGDEEALAFAQALARGTVAGLQANLGCRRIRPDGSFSDHTHIHTHEIWGVADVGAATHNARLLKWARRAYEYVRSRGADYGWFPERMILDGDKTWDNLNARVHISETCVTGDMVNIAACLAQGGRPAYWDDVERYVRNYLRGVQFIMTPEIEAYYRKLWKDKPAGDVDAALASIRRYQGAFGALVPVNGGVDRFQPCGCCAPQGIGAIYTAWKNTVVEDARGVWVNMSFNREAPAATVRSFLPAEGRLSVTPHQPADFHLRPPAWAPRKKVRAFRKGEAITPVWRDDYILFAKAMPGEELTITYPLPEFVQTVGIGGQLETQRPYQVRWRGNTCMGIEPRAAEFPFFEEGPPTARAADGNMAVKE